MQFDKLADVTIGALRFSVALHYDQSADAPWESEDGHGQVRSIDRCRVTGRFRKDSGERLLYSDGRNALAYNWQGAIATARKDGWGLAPDALAKLSARLGRAPTRGEITAAAVEADFQRLRGYCAGDWQYVGIVVTLQDIDGSDIPSLPDARESLWSIESDCADYQNETARELAAEIAARVGRRKTLHAGARSYRIRK